ncbi:thiamine diphosphokinase [Spiroplasma alleghenense]|uniref:Thiamine diphosphokinase n=1 Tax=Spiroplasma alleghenense TaxID=216931 RepID=A0A345Z417_9MOLU|nr:thiamine diphosphokinase [Spiroplasma alleghenense]AXK51346.1 thiamine pyrophosphokinase [Spiroplasma alleghenense]
MNNQVGIVVTYESDINFEKFPNAYFIGVERGCLDLIKKKVKIDLAISDFDHVDESELALIKQNALKTTVLDPEKDYIDGEIAIQEALKLGIKKIIYVSKPNIRHDMNLANLFFAFKYDVDVLSDKSLITILKQGKNNVAFDKYQDYTYISFVANKTSSLTIKGLKYEASNLQIDPYSLQAISNCFIPYQDGMIECNEDIAMIMTK